MDYTVGMEVTDALQYGSDYFYRVVFSKLPFIVYSLEKFPSTMLIYPQSENIQWN